MKMGYIAGASALVAFGSLLIGNVANAQAPFHHPDSVNQRLRDQHARIRQGMHSGELTRGEVRNLNRRDARVLRQERRDRFFHAGHLTPGERRHLNGELNHDSGTIYRDKHNDRVR